MALSEQQQKELKYLLRCVLDPREVGMACQLYLSGIITVNEARANLGYPVLDNDPSLDRVTRAYHGIHQKYDIAGQWMEKSGKVFFKGDGTPMAEEGCKKVVE